MLLNLTILPGDGIGPEVTEQAILVLQAISDSFGHQLQLSRKSIGGAALSASNDPLPADTLQACLASSAVLLGAVGNPAFDHYPNHLRPEAGLLRLRRELGAYANLRPAICFPALEDSSPLRADLVRGTDIMIVRELLGGLYFGEPRAITGVAGNRVALNTMTYDEPAIERIARVAFELAIQRRQKVLSVDKANVLECSRLWREVVTRFAKDYPAVQLSHMYVDSAAMSWCSAPKISTWCSPKICLATFSPTRREEWWARSACWRRQALAVPSACTNPFMAPLPISLAKESQIPSARFSPWLCCCAIRFNWRAKLFASRAR